MNSDRWQQVRVLLEEAIALPAHERSKFLESACPNDVELRDELESLLRSHDDAGSIFMKTPAADLKGAVATAAAAAPNRIGRRIGVYEIVEEIGHGGMGEVYRAKRVDGQFDQQVAIKLVRIGMDAPTVLERFRHERQILASLDHPNIARLYDGGTTAEGIPYLVMELIEGTPVDLYCEEHALDINGRLNLFLQVCGAVQYAHQRLVIHRDIKPSNILVTAGGFPKLLDFGIAKILDPSASAEATLLRPMTPEYASPEQIRGEPITTSSDVYSLGVVLYRLLAGRSPYPEKTDSPLEFARVVCEFEPSKPSTAPAILEGGPGEGVSSSKPSKVFASDNSANYRRALKGDLDNIALKALRKEPDRRYASAEQLGADIRRRLDGLPVGATPDSAIYRVNKFVRRHKAGAMAAALIAVAVAAGVVSTLWEARVAIQQRARAERRFNDVRKLASSFLFEFDEAIKNLPGSTPARSLVVKRALEYLDGLAAEARGDHSLQIEIASAYKKVGEVQGDPMFPNLGDSQGALISFDKAQAILESLSHSEPENQQVQLALASTHQQISDVLHFTGDTGGAVAQSGEALRIYESLAPTLAGDHKFQTERVTQTYHYANLLSLAGSLDQAASEFRKAAELSRQMIAADRHDQEGKIHLATSVDGLGYVLQDKGDTAGALENRRLGLGIREELVRLDPNNAHYRRQLAFSHHDVGLSLVEAGEMSAALANFRQELALFESLGAADPKDAQGRRNQSLAHKQIGDVLKREGDIRGALAHYRTALDIDRDLAAADPRNSQVILDLSFSESKTGTALGKLGHPQEASAMLRRAVARQESLIATDPHHILLYNHLANSYVRLADFLVDRRDRKQAVAYYRKAVAARLTYSEKNPNSSTNRRALAECYTNLAKALGPRAPEEALKQYNSAVELLEPLTAVDRSNAQYRIALANAFSNTARLYVQMARTEPSVGLQCRKKARSLYVRSQELWVELEKAGRLPPGGAQAIRQVSSELAQCNDSLAKLRQAD